MYESTVELLLAAHRTMTPVDTLDEVRRAHDLAASYEVQERFSAAYSRVIGYKLGAASKSSQAIVGATEPFYGRLFAADTHLGGAELRRSDFFSPGMEGEFAFRFGRDLNSGDAPFRLEDLDAALDAVLPAIEICDTRFRDWKAVSLEEIVADNAFHGGLVMGEPVTSWRAYDFRTHEISLAFDNEIVGRGPGALILGNPLNGVLWTLNRMAERGQSIKAGDIIAAGTCTGLHHAPGASEIRASLGAIGEVRFRFA